MTQQIQDHGPEYRHIDDMPWETLRFPGQHCKMVFHPRPERPSEPEYRLRALPARLVSSAPSPRFRAGLVRARGHVQDRRTHRGSGHRGVPRRPALRGGPLDRDRRADVLRAIYRADRPGKARSTTGASTCRSANPCRKKICRSDARAVATTPDEAERKEVAEYEALAERAYDDMYRLAFPRGLLQRPQGLFRAGDCSGATSRTGGRGGAADGPARSLQADLPQAVFGVLTNTRYTAARGPSAAPRLHPRRGAISAAG